MVNTNRFVKGSPAKREQMVCKSCGTTVEKEPTLISNDRLITKGQNKEVGRLEKHKKRNLTRNTAETSEMCNLDNTQISSPANSEHNIEWKQVSTAVSGNTERKRANLPSSSIKTKNSLSLKEILMKSLKKKLLSLSNERRTNTEKSQQVNTTLSRFTVPRLDSRVHLNNHNNPSIENKLLGSERTKSDRQERILPISWIERKAIEAPSKADNSSKNRDSSTLVDPIIKKKFNYKKTLIEKHRRRSISLPARISAENNNKINIQSMKQSAKETNADKRKGGKICKEKRFFCKLTHGGSIEFIKNSGTMEQSYEDIVKFFQGIATCLILLPMIFYFPTIFSNHNLFYTLNTEKIDRYCFVNPTCFTDDILCTHIVGQKRKIQLTRPKSLNNPCLIQPIKVGFSSSDFQKRLVSHTEPSMNRISKAHFNANETPAAFSLRVKNILDSYLDYKISRAAKIIWNVGLTAENFHQMIFELRKTKVGKYNLSNEVLFDLWGLIVDWKNDRLRDQKKNIKN